MTWLMDDAMQATLVRQACEGETSALDRLVEHFRPKVFRYCLSRLGSVELADDVTQEVCLGLVRALPTYEQRGRPLSAFVFGIAANQVAMARRGLARSREVPHSQLPDRASADVGPAHHAVLADQVARLLGPLRRLPDRQREVLLLRVVAQLSAEETAAVMGMTSGAVRVAQHRALQRLRELVGGEGDD